MVRSASSKEDIILDDDALRTLLLFLEPLFRKVVKPLNNEASSRTVKNVDRRAAHPSLKFVDGKRNILGVILVEHPYFSICGRLRHAMPIIMKQHSLILGVSSKRQAQFLHLLNSRIKALLVARLCVMGRGRAEQGTEASLICRETLLKGKKNIP